MRIKRSDPVSQPQLHPDAEPPMPSLTLEEKYVVWMKNRAMTMLAMPYDESATGPAQVPAGVDLSDPEVFQDAIADILQLAEHVGLDGVTLFSRATEQQQAIRRQGQEANGYRLRRTPSGAAPDDTAQRDLADATSEDARSGELEPTRAGDAVAGTAAGLGRHEYPDLSVHFFDHCGGDQEAAETHLGTVTIPGYFWEQDEALDLAKYVYRVSDLFFEAAPCGLCFTVVETDADMPLNGHGPVDGDHASALLGVCGTLMERTLFKTYERVGSSDDD